MKNLILSCTILTAILLLNACKKNDEDIAAKRTQYLTSGKWFYQSVTDHQTSPFDTVYDRLGDMDNCDRDNYFQFNTDSTFIVHENIVMCNGSQEIKDSGTWQFYDNNSSLVMKYNNNASPRTESFFIESLNSKSLTLMIQYQFLNGSEKHAGKFTAKFTH